MVAVLVGGSLACSGSFDFMPADPAPEVDEDDDAPVAKRPLPAVTADEEERGADCMPESYETADHMLAETQSGGASPTVDAGPNRIVETVVMKNGMEVRVTRGGCTHAGESWQVSPAPKGAWVAAAKKVLSHVDTAEDPSVLKCLHDAPDPPPKSGWASGEAHCTIAMDDGMLVFTYDFAL